MINLDDMGITPRNNKYARIQFKRDTESNLANEVLLDGEIGYAIDKKKFKIGDGETIYSELKYLTLASELEEVITGLNTALNSAKSEINDSINDLETNLSNNISNHINNTNNPHNVTAS